MVTPRGQEWLRGLWDTDTDPNSLHTYFVSRRTTCLQPCVHIQYVSLYCVWWRHCRLSQYHRIISGVKWWEGCSLVVFFTLLALFNYQMKKGTAWWCSRANCVFPSERTLLLVSPISVTYFTNHILTFPHWWACRVASLVRHSGPNSSKGELIFEIRARTGSIWQDRAGPSFLAPPWFQGHA